MKLARRFVLYVSETREQADEHVQTIAAHFESIGVDRALTKYGHSKGWSQQQLRTVNGFNVRALGLDVAARGLKKDQYRPDLIIFDDIDNESDTPKTVTKKENAIRSKIMAAGSADVAFLFLQNLIHDNSVISRLLDGTSEWLLDREVAPIEPAVEGLEVEKYDAEDGSRKWRIIAGKPSWEGQDLAICEQQINSLGLETFRREMQHEVKGLGGYFFNEAAFGECDWADVPRLIRVVLAFDIAATEGGGDYTVAALLGMAANGVIYVLHVVRKQLGTDNVRKLVRGMAVAGRKRFGNRSFSVRIAQDPGSAGKNDAEHLKQLLTRAAEDFAPFSSDKVHVQTVTGSKATRAKEWQVKVNEGNAVLVRPSESDAEWLPLIALDGGQVARWPQAYRKEHHRFREDEQHDFDDQVDASADAVNELVVLKQSWDF